MEQGKCRGCGVWLQPEWVVCRYCGAPTGREGAGPESSTQQAPERPAPRSQAHRPIDAALDLAEAKTLVANIDARFPDIDDLYTGDNIPDSKLCNARKTCEVPDDETILVLLDATVFGSAKNAMLIGTRAIYLHNDWASDTSGRWRVGWEELVDATPEERETHEARVGRKACLNTSGSSADPDEAAAIAALARQILLARR